MTNKEFFEMNVGDEFEICTGEHVGHAGKYKVYDIEFVAMYKKIMYRNTNGDCGFIILNNLTTSIIGFISHAQKLSKKTPVEKVQEKIDVLKLELSKLEAEKKSLEIQVGHFYEIMYSDSLYKKTETFYIKKIDYGVEGVFYHVIDKNGKIKYINKHSTVSFKRISDISVIEEAWKNV